MKTLEESLLDLVELSIIEADFKAMSSDHLSLVAHLCRGLSCLAESEMLCRQRLESTPLIPV